MRPEQKLTRVAFRVSRLMEFCTKRELQNQTGHSVHDWPLVALKELMDNALDACEEAEIAR
jgi:DNA topoisomerase VI subunit B